MCDEGGYEVSAPTATSDRVCACGTVRSGDQYQTRGPFITANSQDDSLSLPCEVSKDKRQDANADADQRPCVRPAHGGHGHDVRVEGAHGLRGTRVPDGEHERGMSTPKSCSQQAAVGAQASGSRAPHPIQRIERQN